MTGIAHPGPTRQAGAADRAGPAGDTRRGASGVRIGGQAGIGQAGRGGRQRLTGHTPARPGRAQSGRTRVTMTGICPRDTQSAPREAAIGSDPMDLTSQTVQSLYKWSGRSLTGKTT